MCWPPCSHSCVDPLTLPDTSQLCRWLRARGDRQSEYCAKIWQDRTDGRVVELRFFAGLSVKETAEALGVSAATVKRDRATAKLWLYNELKTR